jgi:hypothetical protein
LPQTFRRDCQIDKAGRQAEADSFKAGRQAADRQKGKHVVTDRQTSR